VEEEQRSALTRKISARQLLAFRLVYKEGLTHEQASQIMGISRSAVAMLIKRLRKDFADCVPKRKQRKTLSLDILATDERVKEKF